MTSLVVSVIGAGRIGATVTAHLQTAPDYRLGRVLTRSGVPDTGQIDEFLSTQADLIIDAAGPSALASYGVACLRRAELWSVGAAALADETLRQALRQSAQSAGTRLRLFAPWAFGIGCVPVQDGQSLTLRIARPGLTNWDGPLAEAISRFPDELNFAMAAALCGPGVAATCVDLRDGAHCLEAWLTTSGMTYHSSVCFDGTGPHPTAQSLIAALDARLAPFAYG